MTTNPFFDDRIPVWAELDELLDEPEFDPGVAGVTVTYKRLQTFGRMLGPARKLYHAPGRLLAGMEWAGVVDPAMMHAAMVHYGVAGSTLVERGRPNNDLDRLVAEFDTVDAPGVIVATELGRGGSQVNIRTEARYDHDSRTFTLHTPDDAALKVMPNVGWTGLPRTAVVIARLVAGGTDHGVHAFAFRFPHSRAQVTVLPGGAPVALDYSVIRFCDAEIPFGYWLADIATITESGVDDPLTPQQRLVRSFGGINAAVTCATVALASAARATVAIAARYNTQRLIGYPGAPALQFSTHRTALASAIARVYAITCYVEKVRRDFIDERSNAETTGATPSGEKADYAPWLAANRDRTLAKAAATFAVESVGATCRRLCGFQGVLHTNRITVYEDMARSFHAAGGDTRLLLLEAGKQLLDDNDAPAVPGAGLVDPRSVLRLVSVQERVLVEQLRHRVDRANPNDHLGDVEHLAQVHLRRRILQEFGTTVSTAVGRRRTLLDAVRRLHGLDVLLDSAAWHLNQGSLRPGDLDIVRHAHTAATEHVIRHLDPLIDDLAVPPGRVGGFIGQDDYVDRVASLVRGSDLSNARDL